MCIWYTTAPICLQIISLLILLAPALGWIQNHLMSLMQVWLLTGLIVTTGMQQISNCTIHHSTWHSNSTWSNHVTAHCTYTAAILHAAISYLYRRHFVLSRVSLAPIPQPFHINTAAILFHIRGSIAPIQRPFHICIIYSTAILLY